MYLAVRFAGFASNIRRFKDLLEKTLESLEAYHEIDVNYLLDCAQLALLSERLRKT